MNDISAQTVDESSRSGPIAWMAQNAIAANLLMIMLIGGGIWTAFYMQKEVYPQYVIFIESDPLSP